MVYKKLCSQVRTIPLHVWQRLAGLQEESPRGRVQGPDLPGQGAHQAPHARGEEHDFLSNSCRLLWSDHLKFILWKQFVIFMDLVFLYVICNWTIIFSNSDI